MRIDYSAAERFLSYHDDEAPLAEVWNHPAYDVARKHAELLGTNLSRDDVIAAMAGERTTFSGVEKLDENRERIDQLMSHTRTNEEAWSEQIERHLRHITPDEDVSDVTLFLALGYAFGIGLRDGACVNLNEPLFLETPRQLLYVAIHESSHVVYDRVTGFRTNWVPKRWIHERDDGRSFRRCFTPKRTRRTRRSNSGGRTEASATVTTPSARITECYPMKRDYGGTSRSTIRFARRFERATYRPAHY